MIRHTYVVSAPLFYPVSLEEVYKQCRIDTVGSPPTSDDDALLTSLLAAATEFVENGIRRSLIKQTRCMTMPAFPFERNSRDDSGIYTEASRKKNQIELLMPPVQSINSVSYYDTDNNLQVLASSNYFLVKGEVPILRFLTAFSAPSTYDRQDAVQVEYVAGYVPTGSPPTTQSEFAANVPKSLKQAILLHVELTYNDHMEKEASAIERAKDGFMAPFEVKVLV